MDGTMRAVKRIKTRIPLKQLRQETITEQTT